jgi:hypothetical protein
MRGYASVSTEPSASVKRQNSRGNAPSSTAVLLAGLLVPLLNESAESCLGQRAPDRDL